MSGFPGTVGEELLFFMFLAPLPKCTQLELCRFMSANLSTAFFLVLISIVIGNFKRVLTFKDDIRLMGRGEGGH